jgi:hypothetical protein
MQTGDQGARGQGPGRRSDDVRSQKLEVRSQKCGRRIHEANRKWQLPPATVLQFMVYIQAKDNPADLSEYVGTQTICLPVFDCGEDVVAERR